MPAYGYMTLQQRDKPEELLQLEAKAEQFYHELCIRNTGNAWLGVRRELQPLHMKGVKKRPVFMRLFHTLRPGDVLIIPEGVRLTRRFGELFFIGRILHRHRVRLIVPDLGLDTGNEVGAKMMGITSAFARAIEIRKKSVVGTGKPNDLGKPPLGVRKRGASWEVWAELYDLGLQLTKWHEKGQTWQAIADHLWKHKVYRPPSSQQLRVTSRPTDGLAWTAMSLRKLALNIPWIDQLVLTGKARLPRKWRPKEGPLAELPEGGRMGGEGEPLFVAPAPVPPRKFSDEAIAAMAKKREFKKHWGLNLRAWRKFVGWTQKELARKMGTSQAVVSEAEIGEHLPEGPLKLRFANAVGTTTENLDALVGPPEEPAEVPAVPA